MIRLFKRFLPTRHQISEHRLLRWAGPRLLHPRLWHFSRRGVAVGVGLGIFFGLLVPLGQIPFAAGVAVLVRANVPAAVASTLITNPVTFAPIYIFAHRVGTAVLGEEHKAYQPPGPAAAPPENAGWLESVWHGLLALGKPLILGLAILSITCSLLTYFLIMLIWRLRTSWNWRRRSKRYEP